MTTNSFGLSFLQSFLILSLSFLIFGVLAAFYKKYIADKTNKKKLFLATFALLTLTYYGLSLLPIEFSSKEVSFTEKLNSTGTNSLLDRKVYSWKRMGIQVLCDDQNFAEELTLKIAEDMAKIGKVAEVYPLDKYAKFSEKTKLDSILRVEVKKPFTVDFLPFYNRTSLQCQISLHRLNLDGSPNLTFDRFATLKLNGNINISYKASGFLNPSKFQSQVSQYCSEKLSKAYRKRFAILTGNKVRPELAVDGKVLKPVVEKFEASFGVPSHFRLLTAVESYGRTSGKLQSMVYELPNSSEGVLIASLKDVITKQNYHYNGSGRKEFDANRFRYAGSFYHKSLKKLVCISYFNKDDPSHSAGFALPGRHNWRVSLIHVDEIDRKSRHFRREKQLAEALSANDEEAIDLAYNSGLSRHVKSQEKALLKLLKFQPSNLRYLLITKKFYHYERLYEKELICLEKIAELIKNNNQYYRLQFKINDEIKASKRAIEREQAKQENTDV